MESRHVKAGIAVVALLALAVLTGRSSEPGLFPSIFLAAALAVLVGSITYREGYKTGQRDLIDPPHLRPLTQDQRTQILMRATMPPWRRWLGWAVFAVPQMLFWVFFIWWLAHYRPSGWLVALAIVAMIVVFGIGIWGMEWLWRPFRQAQRQLRRTRTEDK